MSDSIIAKTDPGAVWSAVGQDEQFNFEPPAAGDIMKVSAPAAQPNALNLKDALDWLLGSNHHEDEELSNEDQLARRDRRMDLFLWLLNLEPRLAPYGE